MVELVDGKDLKDNKARSEGEKIIVDTKQKAEELLDDVNGLINQIKKSDWSNNKRAILSHYFYKFEK